MCSMSPVSPLAGAFPVSFGDPKSSQILFVVKDVAYNKQPLRRNPDKVDVPGMRLGQVKVYAGNK